MKRSDITVSSTNNPVNRSGEANGSSDTESICWDDLEVIESTEPRLKSPEPNTYSLEDFQVIDELEEDDSEEKTCKEIDEKYNKSKSISTRENASRSKNKGPVSSREKIWEPTRVVIIEDSRLPLDEDILKQKIPKDIQLIREAFLTVDRVPEYVSKNVTNSTGKLLVLCCVGIGNFIRLQSFNACSQLADHEPCKNMYMQCKDTWALARWLIRKLNTIITALRVHLGEDTEVIFSSIPSVDFLVYQSFQIKKHFQETDHQLDAEYKQEVVSWNEALSNALLTYNRHLHRLESPYNLLKIEDLIPSFSGKNMNFSHLDIDGFRLKETTPNAITNAFADIVNKILMQFTSKVVSPCKSSISTTHSERKRSERNLSLERCKEKSCNLECKCLEKSSSSKRKYQERNLILERGCNRASSSSHRRDREIKLSLERKRFKISSSLERRLKERTLSPQRERFRISSSLERRQKERSLSSEMIHIRKSPNLKKCKDIYSRLGRRTRGRRSSSEIRDNGRYSSFERDFNNINSEREHIGRKSCPEIMPEGRSPVLPRTQRGRSSSSERRFMKSMCAERIQRSTCTEDTAHPARISGTNDEELPLRKIHKLQDARRNLPPSPHSIFSQNYHSHWTKSQSKSENNFLLNDSCHRQEELHDHTTPITKEVQIGPNKWSLEYDNFRLNSGHNSLGLDRQKPVSKRGFGSTQFYGRSHWRSPEFSTGIENNVSFYSEKTRNNDEADIDTNWECEADNINKQQTSASSHTDNVVPFYSQDSYNKDEIVTNVNWESERDVIKPDTYGGPSLHNSKLDSDSSDTDPTDVLLKVFLALDHLGDLLGSTRPSVKEFYNWALSQHSQGCDIIKACHNETKFFSELLRTLKMAEASNISDIQEAIISKAKLILSQFL